MICIDWILRRVALAVCILLLHGRRLDAFVPQSRLNTPKALFASASKSGRFNKKSSRIKGDRQSMQKRNVQKRNEARPVLEHGKDSVNKDRLTFPIDCEHFGTCPGCVVNDHVGNVDVIKSAKLFFSSTAVRKRRLDVSPDRLVVEDADDGFYIVVVPSPLNGWRTQAKLAVAPKSSSWAKDGCSFGLFQRGTHSVLSIPNCKVHHPSINRAVHALVEATEQVGTAAFEPNSSQGRLRYVQFQVERTSGKVCLTLVWYADSLKQTQPALSRLQKQLQRSEPDLWHSMWCHCNDGPGNSIFSRNPNRWHRLVGPEFLREPLAVGGRGWLHFSPLVFRQGNMDGFDILATDVARAIPEKSRVCELYAGIGVLGLTALAYHHNDTGGEPLTWIRCSDENPANSRCFYRSVNSLPSEVVGKENSRGGSRKQEEKTLTLGELSARMESGSEISPLTERTGEKTSYMVVDASAALYAGQALGANVLLVDPPRKGLDNDVIDELCKPFNAFQDYTETRDMLTIPDEKVNWVNDVETLIYVSCGFDALARDCERLLSSRAGWRLESATGYVLFPGSDHVETVAVFQRELR